MIRTSVNKIHWDIGVQAVDPFDHWIFCVNKLISKRMKYCLTTL
jgi:hypothetical protein